MIQQKRTVRSLQEYAGTTVWYDYEVLCPECGKWTEDYGNVSVVEDDGTEQFLCPECAAKVTF